MLDPATLALLVDRLSEACTATLKANRDMTREIGVARRDTERLRARLEAAERSMRTDEVTGLLNQHGIFCILRGALDNFQSAGTTFALALIEPDKFGRLYESWGPTLGNEVIRAIGQHIEMAARTASPGAFTGRIAGFKYLVGLPGLTIGQACKVVDGMRAEVARKVIRRASDGASLGRISLSAGVAMPHVDEADAELLIDRADMALFAASQAGGDRVLPERAS
jgi:diguanylate cyclase